MKSPCLMLNFQTPVIRGLFLLCRQQKRPALLGTAGSHLYKFIGATASRQPVGHTGPTTPKDASKQNARKLN
jgi:hypothetical protein